MTRSNKRIKRTSLSAAPGKTETPPRFAVGHKVKLGTLSRRPGERREPVLKPSWKGL